MTKKDYINCTLYGLEKIANIVSTLRGNKSLNDFADQVGVSDTTIWMLENAYKRESKPFRKVERSAFTSLAIVCGQSQEELIAIATEPEPQRVEGRFQSFAEALPYLEQWSDEDLIKLIQWGNEQLSVRLSIYRQKADFNK